MDRRQFLRGSVVGALGVGVLGCSGGVATVPPAQTAARCEQPVNRAMARLGARYLEEHPDEHDAARALERDNPGVSIATLIRQNRESHDQEAVRGELIAIEGWRLTPTEARIYAVAALRAQ